MKKQTEILNYIRQKCLNGEELKSIKIAKEFKTHQRHLKSAEELGYIKKVGPFKYVWKVGEVIPVMSRAMSKKTTDYYNEKRGNRSITTTAEEPSVIQDCNFWERMYNDLKVRHEGVLKTNKELIEISGRDDKRINELIEEVQRLCDDNEKLKKDSKKLTDLIASDAVLVADLQNKIRQLEDKSSSKRWTFTLFGLPIFGTYEK